MLFHFQNIADHNEICTEELLAVTVGQTAVSQ